MFRIHTRPCAGLTLCALLVLLVAQTLSVADSRAQTPIYVSDEVFIVLHAGPGTNYRWIAKLNPGTPLTATGNVEGEEWTEVRTEGGTDGWVQSEYLSREAPAQVRLPAVERQLAEARERIAGLREELAATGEARESQATLAESTQAELQATAEELAQLKKVSGRAIELDSENRRLVEQVETLRSEVDMLQADNQRLGDKLRSGAFLDGALAVLLGVIITLVVPRLWPRKRRSSSWA
jgi:SH3 domain protein